MKSLFIISLPRSLSSKIYHELWYALRFNKPSWTTAGEILNSDRFICNQHLDDNDQYKFTTKEKNAKIFNELFATLDSTVKKDNFIYKDVVQPFVTSSWLKGKNLRVLKIHRDVAEVVMSMISKNWLYPATAGDFKEDTLKSLIQGLLRAESAIEQVNGESLFYNEIIHDEKSMEKSIKRLYPAANISPIHYINDKFLSKRDEYLKRRKTDSFKRMEDLVNLVQNQK